MALQDIIDKIKSDTKKQVSEIENSALENCSKITESAKQKAQKMRQQILSENEHRINGEKSRLIVSTNIEFNKKLLAEKRRWIDEAFKIAFEKTKNISDNKYNSFMKKLIVNAIDTGKEEIIFSQNDYKKLADMIKKINTELVNKGKKGEIKILKGDIPDGFIIKQGMKEKNFTYDTIFRYIKETLESEVAQILVK